MVTCSAYASETIAAIHPAKIYLSVRATSNSNVKLYFSTVYNTTGLKGNN